MKLKMVLLLSLLWAQTALAADKVTLMLEWFVNPDHAAIIVAKQKGFFERAGLDVVIQEPSDPSLPPKLVAAGKVDLAVGYQPDLYLQVDNKLPITRVATLIATPLNTVLVLKSSNINKISDLKGKKVGYSTNGFESIALKTMLEYNGLSIKDVELINVNFALSTALASKQVDAVTGAYRNFELNELALRNQPAVAFYAEENGIPSYDELILIANQKTANRDAYRRVVRALEQATQWLINHPNEGWQVFKSYKPKDLDSPLNRRAWQDTLVRLALRPAALDRGRYEHMAEFMFKNQQIKTIPRLEDYTVEYR